MNFFKRIRAFYHPEAFQGWGRQRKYFEGWYYKIVSADQRQAFAFIPGIAFDESGKGHSFVQVLNGKAGTASYYRFGVEKFKSALAALDVSVDESRFTDKGLKLSLPDIQGDIEFENIVTWPSSWASPGIMGPYSYAPFMECNHGIVSMDHSLNGHLVIDGYEVSLKGGRGYCEKDWGRSFPSAYIWMQTNHFSTPGISMKSSVARIPWVTGAFTGFIAGVWLGDRLVQFTTYNGTKLIKAEVSRDHVDIVLQNRSHLLQIRAYRPVDHTELASPILGAMEGRISESMTAEINVHMSERKTGVVLLDDTGRSAGLEVAGEIEMIATPVD